MNIRFYQRLAWDGMKKNKKLYFPYLFTCVSMVMTAYILQNLSYCPLLYEMKGAGSIELVLSLGKFVVAIFSLIFLLYTSSFLLRRRKKEFGLYHILGMGKRGIRRIVFWESLTAAFFGLVVGMALGALFSKLVELGLARLLQKPADYSFTVRRECFGFTFEIYGAIFLILMIRAMIGVQRTGTLELLRSERMGEKPPKANWAIALLGALLLGIAYYMAVSIQSPLTALFIFFIAVILVILATYLLFTAGSVTLCRLLQKNPDYYYKKQHFVSVSSMAFRMKRNGAGLASICILSTMVLVMLSSTSSLYFGMENTINGRYPRDISVAVMAPDIRTLSEENISALREKYEQTIRVSGFSPENVTEYRFAEVAGLLSDGEAQLDYTKANVLDELHAMANLYQFLFVGAQDYNRIMDTDLHPQEGEAYLLTKECSYDRESISIEGVDLKIRGQISGTFPVTETVSASVAPYLIFVVPELESVSALEEIRTDQGSLRALTVRWAYAFDLPGASAGETNKVIRECKNRIQEIPAFQTPGGGYAYTSYCKPAEREDFIATFGGMFFLGLVLSFLFLLATVLIIYYKQVSEGYEDQARFEIMQKVGMTKKDIKKSIDSQVLTVFFAPLLFAGLHLAFAYPLIWKILQLFYMHNLLFVIAVTLAAYAVFGIFYMVVYKLTAGVYYGIVSGVQRD